MKLTKLVPALVAVLAFSALTASAASAKEYKDNSNNKNEVMLFGSQSTTHKFNVDGQNTECTSANFETASTPTPDNKVEEVKAAYNNCTAFGFPASVNMGTCTYTFQEPNITDADFPGVPMAQVSVKCNSNTNVNSLPNNGDIRVFASVFGSECEVHVDETGNQNRSTLNFANNTPNAGKVRVGAAVNSLTAQKTKDNGLCPLSGANTTANATYNGNTDVEATEGIGIEVS